MGGLGVQVLGEGHLGSIGSCRNQSLSPCPALGPGQAVELSSPRLWPPRVLTLQVCRALP